MKRLKLCVSLLLGFAAIGVLWCAPRWTVAAMQDVQFNRDIRPILSDRCFYCHGPDDKNRKAGLRLDTFEGATKDRGGYRAITPGKPDDSELIRRVTSHEPGEVMPPLAAKKAPITPEEATLLKRWITQGAKYEGHWAFQPLAKTAPPAVKNTKWIRNDIDRFILARLEREGMQPSPQADARTLIRRVSLDLTGPPKSKHSSRHLAWAAKIRTRRTTRSSNAYSAARITANVGDGIGSIRRVMPILMVTRLMASA